MIDVLARVVRGDATAVQELAAFEPADVLHQAFIHGVLPLIQERVTAAPAAPAVLRTRLEEKARQETLADLLREAELRQALAALDRAGTSPLIMKGTHLAYTHYARPDLRPRQDTDLLVPHAALPAAHEALSALGYEKQGGVTGDFVSSQSLYVKRLERAPTNILDVHWKIANAQVFADVLGHEELARSAISIPALGPAARGLSNVHALLLACVHRMAHHLDSDRLIWLYDIHIVGQRLTPDEWTAFAALAADRQVVAVCRRSLERARDQFSTEVPSAVWEHPRWRSAGKEPSAGYLAPRRRVDAVADDLRALSTWTARWRLAREHLFPPSSYMRDVYAPASRAPLAYLYVRRLVLGARKWLRTGK
jgi:hypothetical protein